MKLIDYQCPYCGTTKEDWDNAEFVICNNEQCRIANTSGFTADGDWVEVEGALMLPIFTPKNNSQRAYVRDERK